MKLAFAFQGMQKEHHSAEGCDFLARTNLPLPSPHSFPTAGARTRGGEFPIPKALPKTVPWRTYLTGSLSSSINTFQSPVLSTSLCLCFCFVLFCLLYLQQMLPKNRGGGRPAWVLIPITPCSCRFCSHPDQCCSRLERAGQDEALIMDDTMNSRLDVTPLANQVLHLHHL